MSQNYWPAGHWQDHEDEPQVYRWVEKDYYADFGEIWYNEESELIFIRRVTHEFENKSAQIMHESNFLPRNCVFIGEL